VRIHFSPPFTDVADGVEGRGTGGRAAGASDLDEPIDRCLALVSEKPKRVRRLPAHSIGRILKPRQQGVSSRNEAIAYALVDQAQRVAGALPRQLGRMVEQLQ
jgi:hypothetical protein